MRAAALSSRARSAPAVGAGPRARRRRRACRCHAGAYGGGDVGDDVGDAGGISLPIAGVDTDWREFRARLAAREAGNGTAGGEAGEAGTSAAGASLSAGAGEVSGRDWAHPLPVPEAGCLLLAHPQLFSEGPQKYFHQACIFLFEHSAEGSAGIILNRRTSLTMGKVSSETEAFGDNALYLGGDVGRDCIHLLHSNAKLAPDATEIVNGVFMGGFEGARTSVEAGDTSAEDYRWFVRYCGWGPGQLESEVGLNVWILAAASPSMVLKETEGNKWAEVLTLLGADYAQLARAHESAESPEAREKGNDVPADDDGETSNARRKAQE